MEDVKEVEFNMDIERWRWDWISWGWGVGRGLYYRRKIKSKVIEIVMSMILWGRSKDIRLVKGEFGGVVGI